jgi:hypothetical protein
LQRSEPPNPPWAERLPAVPLGRQVLVMALAFTLPTLLARAIGAGWGAAAAFGQLAFLAAVTWAICAGQRRLPSARAGSQ